MIGNEEDFTAVLGFEVPGTDESLAELDAANFRRMIDAVTKEYDNFQVVATTLRTVRSATVNDWGAVAWSAASGFVEATHRPGLEILDRVGGGDSFASGLIYGLMTQRRPGHRGGVRRGARRAGHDHPRGHLDGQSQGGRGADAGRRRPGPALTGRGSGGRT